MKKLTKKRYPYETGINVQGEHTNSFSGRLAEAVKEEFDTTLFLKNIGEQHFRFSQAAKRVKKIFSLQKISELEQEAEKKKSLLMHLQVEPNPLRYTTLLKVILSYIIVFFGMLAEFFIYQNIAENSFGMSEFKSYMFGTTVVLLTKFVQAVFQKHVKAWIKEHNLLIKSVFKTLLFVIIGFVLLNSMLIGINNLKNIERNNKIAKLEYVSNSIEAAEENGEDTDELEEEYYQIQTELNGKESTFFTIVKYVSIILIGFLAVMCGAIMFSLADLYNDALRLRKSIKQLKDHQADLRAKFNSYISTYNNLLSLQREVIELHGQKHFLEKLLSPEREKDTKVKPS